LLQEKALILTKPYPGLGWNPSSPDEKIGKEKKN
jgi:hypothetical protein